MGRTHTGFPQPTQGKINTEITIITFAIKNIPYGQSSAKLPVILSLGHSVSLSLGHSVTWSLGHSVNQSLGHYFQHYY